MVRLPWIIRSRVLNPYKILPIAQENTYLGKLSYCIVKLYIGCFFSQNVGSGMSKLIFWENMQYIAGLSSAALAQRVVKHTCTDVPALNGTPSPPSLTKPHASQSQYDNSTITRTGPCILLETYITKQ